MRFIHAADVHIDSPLVGLRAYNDAPAEQLRNATRDAFTELVTLAIDEQVDFIVIAGDLYDGTWPDFSTGLYFCGQMGRLNQANIPVYVLFGNHDAESEMTLKLKLPPNVRTFSAKKPETHLIDDLKVALHGRSFKTKAVTENLVTGYPAPVPGYVNIGVLHTALEGSAAHANYAPCTIEELHAKGYDYWALGHVHEYWMSSGRSTIVFPGNLQGRNIREVGRRGAVMVTVDGDCQVSVARLFIDVLRWESLVVDVSACESLEEVSAAVSVRLEELMSEDAHVPRAVRVTVRGESAAHGELFGLESHLRANILAAMAALNHDKLWLEKVKVETTAPSSPVNDSGSADAMAALRQLLAEADQDPELAKQISALLLPLCQKAPEVLPHVPALEAVRQGDVSAVIRDVAPALLARLAQAE